MEHALTTNRVQQATLLNDMDPRMTENVKLLLLCAPACLHYTFVKNATICCSLLTIFIYLLEPSTRASKISSTTSYSVSPLAFLNSKAPPKFTLM